MSRAEHARFEPDYRGVPPQQQPLIEVALAPEHELVWVPSCAPHEMVRRAVHTAGRWPGGGASYPKTALGRLARVEAVASLRSVEGIHDGDREVEALRDLLNDGTADALDAVGALCVSRRDPDGWATIDAKDVLGVRGVRPNVSGPDAKGRRRRGGYSTRQVEAASRALKQVAAVYLRATKKDGQGEAVDLSGHVYEFEPGRLGSARHLSFRVRPGPAVAHFLGRTPGLSRQVAPIPRGVFALDRRTRAIEKRLVKHVGSYLCRTMASELRKDVRPEEVAVGIGVRALLEILGLEVLPNDPGHTRRRLEAAFDLLRPGPNRLAFIAGWGYEGGPPGRHGKWSSAWLKSKVFVRPSPAIVTECLRVADRRRAHLGLVEGGRAKDAPAHAPLAEKVRARRAALGITQADLARKLAVNQSTVVRLERGSETRNALREKVEKWLTEGA